MEVEEIGKKKRKRSRLNINIREEYFSHSRYTGRVQNAAPYNRSAI